MIHDQDKISGNNEEGMSKCYLDAMDKTMLSDNRWNT